MPETEKEGKKIKVRFPFINIFIKILVFAVLVAGTVIGLRPLQLTLQHQIETVKDKFISQAEEYWGRKIQYGSMGPSIFGLLDIRDVHILRDDDSILVNISRLRLSYSLINLLRGDLRNAFQSVRIDRPVLNLDFEKDADLLKHFSSLRHGTPADAASDERRTTTGSFRDLLPENFSFRIWNGEWEAAGSVGKFKLQGVEIDASVRQSRVSFQGRWDAAGSLNGEGGAAAFLAALKPETSSPAFEALMSGRISGEYSEDIGEGSATVVIPSFSGNYFRLKPLTISFFLSDTILEMRKTHDRSPAAISLVYNLDTRGLQGHFEGEKFSLSDLLVFTGSWQDYNPWLAFRLSGAAGFERESSGALSYDMNVSGVLPGNSLPAPASLELKASGNTDRVSIDTLDVRSPYGNLDFSGGMAFAAVAPYGSLSLSDLKLRQGPGVQESPGINCNFSISTRGREISLFGDNFTAGNVTLSALDISLYREEGGLSFAFSALRFRNMGSEDRRSYENVRMGSFSLEGSMDYEPRHINARVTLDSFSVGDILGLLEPLAPLPAMPSFVRSAAEDLSVTTEVFFTTDFDHILYNAPRIAAAYEGIGDILAAASLSGTDRRFELSGGHISWAKGEAEISSSVDFSDPQDISFSLGTTYKDLTYFFEGMILEHRDISVRGSYGFQVNLSAGRGGAYSGYAQGDNIPIPSGDKFASLSFLCSLFYDSPASWQAAIERFQLTGLTTPSSTFASLSFSGSANETGMNIPNIAFEDGRGAIGGDISLAWDPSYSYCRFRAEMNGADSREYYGLNGIYRDKKLDLNFSGIGMQFARISSHNAVADGNLRLSWESPQSFNTEIELSSLILYRQDDTIRASAEASLNSDTLLVRQLTINYSGLEATVPVFRIDRTASRAETEATLQGSFSGNPVEISFRGDAQFNSSESWLDMLLGLNSLNGSITVANASYDTIKSDAPFDLSFSGNRENRGFAFNLSGGPRNMIRFRYTPNAAGGGDFYAALSAPSPVRGAVTGSIDSKNIDAQGSDIYVDLGSLWRFVPPSAGIAFPGGIVNASVRVSGSLADPEFYGSARATSVQILIPEYLTAAIRPVPMTISLNGSEMTFGPVDAAVGQGGGKVSAWFRFERWIPSIFSIDIQVPQESPIPYGFDIAGVIAHGLASGRLIVGMDDKIISINGDLTANNTEISLNSNEIAAMGNGAASNGDNGPISTVTDISIRTGRRVEFFWPSAAFPVLQANADMGTGIRITSDSMARRFTLTGNVKLRSGEIFYLERNFYLREGTLFFKENETEFDPRISARAEIRDQAENGPVTVSMIIDNAPIREFTPRFESNPPLSQIEIYSLLGQNPQGGAAGGTQRNVAASVAIDSLAQFTVIRRLQQRVRDFLGLDMLSVRTQVLQNVVLQATAANQTTKDPKDNTVDRTYRVGNYFDNTTVFIGKYFGSEMFGQAMLTFKYDENKLTWGGLRLEPEIGLEMRNPLFDIHFNIIPLHPETWFVDDVSFSLIWRRSF